MKKLIISGICLLTFASGNNAQVNTISTNPVVEQILLGNFSPIDYRANSVITSPELITSELVERISADTMKATLLSLEKFENRNSGSDTVSQTKGIGASRRWIFNRLKQYSSENENRLQVSYLQFDAEICGAMQHRNVFAVLPGSDKSAGAILMEAHMDTRCDTGCDTACVAQGMEDNGSGTALVIELARVMSKYTFNSTLVFMLTTGEEQGLLGSTAFADYVVDKGIEVKAVLNNDVIGGIYCGNTSSAPSCPGLGDVDSTQVRIFSSGGFNSPHKGLARYIKMQYAQNMETTARVKMAVTIMSAEDRTGRGGDHRPFRMKGIPAIRFTCANEHGHGHPELGDYQDRQHTSKDILGVDTDNDQVIDSFYIDFNYLKRNAEINGGAAAMIAMSPAIPDITTEAIPGGIVVDIDPIDQIDHYLIGIRKLNSNDFDTLISWDGITSDTIKGLEEGVYYALTVSAVDSLGVESCFSREERERVLTGFGDYPEIQDSGVELLQNKPNPFDETTIISVLVQAPMINETARIDVRDLQGRLVKSVPVELRSGMNEIIYDHGYNAVGVHSYSLFIGNRLVQTRQMVFAY